MSWASSLKVPATVHFADGAEAAGSLHLQPAVAHHPGPETVMEMLNRDEHFLVLTFEGSGIAFIPKAQVALIETAAPEQEDGGRVSAAIPLQLEVEMMVTARVIEGVVAAELPPTRARAQDFLNDGGTFFPLQVDATLWAVNRTHVRTVRPVD